MQAPTYAEFETFNKVSAWIFANAPSLSLHPLWIFSSAFRTVPA
jgi:hypothetical protein